MADTASQTFLPWVQPAAAGALPAQAVERLAPDQPAAAPLQIVLAINGEPITQEARLYGPGDVTGIDLRQAVRLDPPPGTTDFEPNLFPLVEFDRPDFPWLFTPLRADAQGRLRPWLCLVVVRKQPGVSLRPDPARATPTLRIAAPAVPARELPDLAEAHLWAHAQVTGVARAALQAALDADSPRTVARLLCPRRLDPATEYLACVVPAFEAGRKAGLGLPVAANEDLRPAWRSGASAPVEVTLPVYLAWEFRTGEGGDFEALARRLAPHPLPAEVGRLPVNIARPGFRIEPPLDPGATLALEGALRPAGAAPAGWPGGTKAPFQTALALMLNAPWSLASQERPDADPIVGPPLYGRWHAGAHIVAPAGGSAPPWLNELNLDPRSRAAAALGAQVVQEHQEQLMAAAWEQLADREQLNTRRRRAQLSRAVNQRILDRTFRRLPEEQLLQIVAPARARVQLAEGRPLAARLAASLLPAAAYSAPLRRMASPRGVLSRTYARGGASRVSGMLAQFNLTRALSPRDGGVTSVEGVSGAIAASIRPPSFIWVEEPVGHWERISAVFAQMLDAFRSASLWPGALETRLLPATPAALREAVLAHHTQLARLFTAHIPRDFRQPLALDAVRSATLAALDPARAGAALGGSTAAAAALGGGPADADPLEPVMAAPSYPQPMYAALRELRPELILPGLEQVPQNSVQLLETNPRFVEAFMVGLNVELGRELLWRGYPTDQRGTPFRQFWDQAGAAEARPDIAPIHTWGARALGANSAAGPETLVLLLRGDLLRRYPSTVIYAVRAVTRGGALALATDHPGSAQPPLELYPSFRGSLPPDLTFLGFPLTRAAALAGDGWFFVLQQQPTEPRFGLDAAPPDDAPPPALRTWSDLSWAHLAPAGGLQELAHAVVGAVSPAPAEAARGTWGRNGAHMALITRQQPVRVAIHASDLLPQAG